MKIKINRRWVKNPNRHDPHLAMTHFLVASGNNAVINAAAKGAANWELLTSPNPPGLGLNVNYDTQIADVFGSSQNLQQFSGEITKAYGVSLTAAQITSAGTFGQLINVITSKQLA